MNRFPFYKQADSKDCGPTCIKIIAKYHGRDISIKQLRHLSHTNRLGSTLRSISEAAEKIGFRTLGVKISFATLKDVSLPCILHWKGDHFVVVYKIKDDKIFLSDPAIGLINYNQNEFLKNWIGSPANSNTEEGIALFLEPTPNLKKDEFDSDLSSPGRSFGYKFLYHYISPYKTFILQLIFGLLAASLLQLIVPFLTQSVVDVGIQNQNIHFVYMVLAAQLFLFFGKATLEIIRGWILLHLSTRINIAMISDFFIKLMNLPISFFDVRMTGDILQRINDHHRIENILTNSSLTVLFSIFNMFIMGGVLAYYNLQIFTVFFLGSLIYFIWVTLFLKEREKLDYKRFAEVSREQSKVIELISGMQEIKLHNAEREMRWSWEFIQVKLFKVSMRSLTLEQAQSTGSNIINELKNIFIIFLSAKLVINGEITLGMMLAISSIVGSLNGPILQLIIFVREAQDAKISLNRLSEIHNKEDESNSTFETVDIIPMNHSISIKNLFFNYIGSEKNVLNNLSLDIPAGKITAIVGSSGSGKTTLMKLLQKFYDPTSGIINVGEVPLSKISQITWREHVGSVMQEGYIFNDTISSNIAIGQDLVDDKKLNYAAEVANLYDFINDLPLGFNTKVGMEGIGISTGQKQRLLIARAVYKDPSMLFFDEATSSLDTNNEREIMSKLDDFFNQKTVVVIAHRLSTVMNADQIVVLEKGQIIETGNHKSLIEKKGSYYKLVKNQLQLEI